MIKFVSNIDWTKLWWVVGILFTFWSSLVTLTVMYPAFDPYYKVINVILGAAVGALLFAARGGKYVESRATPPPQNGKP